MESVAEKLKSLVAKNRYVLLVALAGLVLMLLPNHSDPESHTVTVTEVSSKSFTEDLESVLSQIRGVGRVRVMLTELEGERIVYAQDEDDSNAAGSISQRRDTVILTDAQRNQSGLILQRIPPVYLGAVVVCQGGDDPQVKLAVVEAVRNATGLSTDHISVLKMK